MKKLFFIATFFATIIGYWLGNADFPQRCLQHALSYPSLAKEVNGAKTFKDTAISHSHAIAGGYSGLEKKALDKMKKLADTPEKWLYIVKKESDIENKQLALRNAAQVAVKFPWYKDDFHDTSTKNIFRVKQGWDSILTGGKELSDETFTFAKEQFLKSAEKPRLIAAIQYEFSSDPIFSQQLLQKIKDVPITGTTFYDWAEVQGTIEMEDVAIRKMALASTTTADLMRKMPRFLNPSKQEFYALVIISYPENFEDCFDLYNRLSMNELVANAWANRCLSLSTSKAQSKQFKLAIKNLPHEVHDYFPRTPWWKFSMKRAGVKSKKKASHSYPDAKEGVAVKESYRTQRELAHQKTINMHNQNAVPDLSGKPGYLTFALDDDCVKKNGGQRDKCFREILISHGKIVSWGKQVTMPITK